MKISFTPFEYSEKLVKRYVLEFRKGKKRGKLYKKTPQTKEEVKTWMFDLLERETIDYYSAYVDKKIAGHIGLREIDDSLGTAALGSFFFRKKEFLEEFVEEVTLFVLKVAKQRNLKIVFCDLIEQPDDARRKVYRKIGFKRDVSKPDYWFLPLENLSF